MSQTVMDWLDQIWDRNGDALDVVGWDPYKNLTKCAEELGEMAELTYKCNNQSNIKSKMAHEIADVILCSLMHAAIYGIGPEDIVEAIERKSQRRKMSMNLRKPKVVCLCGSTKFKQEYLETQFKETMEGNIVLSVGWFSHADGHVYKPTDQEKIDLDELHKRKIDLADEIMVINVNGYVGDSTKSEIEYAIMSGKPIRYLVCL